MAYDIIIGRNDEDKQRFGKDGTILLGKHYVKMGQTSSLSNRIYLDVLRSHVVFVTGKRGSGKSYTLGVIAEGLSSLPEEVAQNLSVLIFDTMGIYWTMKFENTKDKELLEQWEMKPEAMKSVQIYTPKGYFDKAKEEGIPTDFPFSLKPSDLSPSDWTMTFDIKLTDPMGVLIEKTINRLQETGENYGIDSIIEEVKKDKTVDQSVRDATVNRFEGVKGLGLFSKKGTDVEELAKPGEVTILDLSAYTLMPGGDPIRALVIGLVSQKLFSKRMAARKIEEYKSVNRATSFLSDEVEEEKDMPLVWILIDEAHEFIPNDERTTATNSLITILREGRQPGISLVLASQQPGKIHTDVMTQADTVISHRVTAKIDVDSLGALMQSYMREGLDKKLGYLPKVKGSAIIFDDVNERMFSMRVRPRNTWHGGEAPSAIRKKKEETLELDI